MLVFRCSCRPGIVRVGIGTTSQVCSSCLSTLQPKRTGKKSVPPVSAPWNSHALLDFGGEVPTELQDLTLPERLMLCPIKCIIRVMKLVSYGNPNSRQRFVKGNSISFLQDIGEVAAVLPTKGVLSKYLKVCFAGDETCPMEIQQVKRMFVVRRQKVLLALTWLCTHNEAFKRAGIKIDQELIDSLPENGVPDEIIETLVTTKDSSAVLRASSSYVPHDNAEVQDEAAQNRDDGSEHDVLGAHFPDELNDDPNRVPIHNSAVVDADSTTVSEAALIQGAIDNLENTVLKVVIFSTVLRC